VQFCLSPNPSLYCFASNSLIANHSTSMTKPTRFPFLVRRILNKVFFFMFGDLLTSRVSDLQHVGFQPCLTSVPPTQTLCSIPRACNRPSRQRRLFPFSYSPQTRHLGVDPFAQIISVFYAAAQDFLVYRLSRKNSFFSDLRKAQDFPSPRFFFEIQYSFLFFLLTLNFSGI